MNLKQNSGIYFIYIKTPTKKYVYIGQSINISKRISDHRYFLKNNKHSNTYFQNVYNKYGITCVKALYFDKEFLNYKEQKYIDIYLKHDNYQVLNIMPVFNKGYLVSQEIRDKISNTLKNGNYRGKNHSSVNKNKFRFYNVKTKEVFYGMCYELRTKYPNLTANNLDALTRRRVKLTKYWCLYENRHKVKYSSVKNIIYEFYNINTQEVVVMKRSEFQRKYGITSSAISKLLIHTKRNKCTQTKGWKIIAPLSSDT